MRTGILSMAIVTALVAGCGGASGTAPQLPPQGSLSVSFKGMTNSNGLSSKSNWTDAAIRVGVLDLWVGAGLAPEATVFAAAYSQQPTLQGLSWVWTYAVNQAPVNATATLSATVTAAGVNWQMHINGMVGTTSYNNFLWFDGTSNLTSGNWQIYSQTGKLVLINWTVNSATDADLKFTDNSGGANNGNTLEYKLLGDAATVNYGFTGPKTAAINWSVSTLAGSIVANDYNSGAKACWDTQLYDITCP
jgi:hypothetical protein